MKLHFMLSGNSSEHIKKMSNDINQENINTDILELIKDTVAGYFGNRALVIINEDEIINTLQYSACYSAGWFIDKTNELVIIGHDDNMNSANKLVNDYAKIVNWNKYSIKV